MFASAIILQYIRRARTHSSLATSQPLVFNQYRNSTNQRFTLFRISHILKYNNPVSGKVPVVHYPQDSWKRPLHYPMPLHFCVKPKHGDIFGLNISPADKSHWGWDLQKKKQQQSHLHVLGSERCVFVCAKSNFSSYLRAGAKPLYSTASPPEQKKRDTAVMPL